MASTAIHPTPQPPHLLSTTTTTPSSKTSTPLSPHDVSTSLNYHLDNPDGSPPHPSYVGRPETYDRPTFPLDVTIHDIRGPTGEGVGEYTLDKNGFQLYRFPSGEKEFLDDEKIKREYYPETERLLKEATGATQVFIFDHTIRRPTLTNPSDPEPTPSQSLRGPVQRVHIDQSYQASLNRVTHHLPTQAPELLKGRVEIINVWRPINPIQRHPLAIADASSVPESDLVPIPLIYPDRAGETFAVRPNKEHRWYYAHGQTPDEVLLIKCFDSKVDGRARRVPHTAFVDPATEHLEPRQSIEIRALVFHPDDTE